MSSSSFCCTARCVALSGDCDSRRSCKICCKPLCSGCQFILVCNLEKFHVTCYQFKGNVWKISLFFRTKWKDKNSWNWRVFVNIQTFERKKYEFWVLPDSQEPLRLSKCCWDFAFFQDFTFSKFSSQQQLKRFLHFSILCVLLEGVITKIVR